MLVVLGVSFLGSPSFVRPIVVLVLVFFCSGFKPAAFSRYILSVFQFDKRHLYDPFFCYSDSTHSCGIFLVYFQVIKPCNWPTPLFSQGVPVS